MLFKSICVSLLLTVAAHAQGTVPTFTHAAAGGTYTIAGKDPAQGGTTTIPTVLVPITLTFESKPVAGKPFVMDAAADVPHLLKSPVFSNFAFPGGATQYADAMLRTTFSRTSGSSAAGGKPWHTLLGKPEIKPIAITIPTGYGYILTSKKSGQAVAVADVEYIQRELFKQVPKQDGKLVIAVLHNTTLYADGGDATVCCSWGAHGVNAATGNSFVLSSYLQNAPAVVTDSDVQPLTQQLAEFFNDPLHDPLIYETRGKQTPDNATPAWKNPTPKGGCGGTGIASTYFLLEPTDTNPKNNFPSSKAFAAPSKGTTYHLQNVALLPWYTGTADGLGTTYSFPDAQLLPAAAERCPARNAHSDDDGGGPAAPLPSVAAIPQSGPPNGHHLIGYWSGYGNAESISPMREISPQWDVIIVAFATPAKNAPEGTMQFHTPAGYDPAKFKADIAYMQSQGKKVMISLGGGGEHFTLADPTRVPTFISSVTQIVSEYGFDGIDIDFESPSLSIDPGDTDFKNPKTPSIVNLVSALRQLHDHFGQKFMISLVPEGTQIPSGYPSYGGQFGSYLAISYAIRDILSFMDVQDYNTPPLQGLDGEIYQPGTVDYHAAMTELVLRGFNVGGDPNHFYPPLPADKVAVGFLTYDTTPPVVSQAMDYIITGKAPAGTTYKMLSPNGYPGMIGAMFWTIDGDRAGEYKYSNLVGPQLHGYPASK